jgi:FAD/FMN-containing dehydrogenase
VANPTKVVEGLKRQLPDVVVPGESGWDQARAAWNLAVDQRPAAVALPATPAEVAAVVAAARTAGLRIAAQTTGHAAGALASLDDTVLLKTSKLTGVELRPEDQSARVGAATLWGEVERPASREGLAPLSGSSPNVGVAGYSLGGGLSWLARRHGLATDSLTALELVTADGELRRVDHDHDPELFWALRGGGGNFGVVTALEFRLYPAQSIAAGWLIWPWERAAEVLPAWSEWIRGVPDEVTSIARLLQLPPLPDLPEGLRGRRLVVVEAVMLADEETADGLLRPLRALRPERDTFAMVSPEALGGLHMDPPQPTPAFGRHALLTDLPEAAIDALLEAAGPGTDSPLLAVELRHLGGALARPASDGGALSSLDAWVALLGAGIVADPEAARAVASRAARLVDATRPWAAGLGFSNFAENGSADTSSFLPPEVNRRLQRIKAEVDPGDLFRANHPLPPAANSRGGS